MEKRKSSKRIRCVESPFAARIICSDCGGYYGRKVWHPGTNYAKRIWRCNHKYDGENKCTTPHFYED